MEVVTMSQARAVLFDFGGTLFDYETLAPGEREVLISLARWAGIEADEHAIRRTYRAALKRVFYEYLPRPYYLHGDLFGEVLHALAKEYGATLSDDLLARYRAAQFERRAQDFILRDGVRETLEQLRSQGLHLGIVSNVDDDHFSQMIELSQLEPYFDSLLTSEQAQSCKPDAGIFHEALRRAGCAPSEAFFVGDSVQQDIAGANQLGLRSVLIWSRDDQSPPDRDPRPQHVIRRIPDLLTLLPQH